MPTRVTIAYDGSPGATEAIRAAAGLFHGAHASIVTVPDRLLTAPEAIPRTVPTVSAESVERAYADLAGRAAETAHAIAAEGVEQAVAAGLEAEPAIAPGTTSIWAALLAAAHEARADVLVCGTRGHGTLARAVLGSTSNSLLHHSDLPLLIAPEGAGELSGPALIAYDGSETAARAIEVGGRVLADRRAIVAHVWESPYRHSRTGRALASAGQADLHEIVTGLETSLEQAARELTDAGVELARFAGLEARGETLDSGDGVWRALVEAARGLSAAVVVSGARGLGGARSALLGSVSSGLVHNAGRPVLIVPA